MPRHRPRSSPFHHSLHDTCGSSHQRSSSSQCSRHGQAGVDLSRTDGRATAICKPHHAVAGLISRQLRRHDGVGATAAPILNRGPWVGDSDTDSDSAHDPDRRAGGMTLPRWTEMTRGRRRGCTSGKSTNPPKERPMISRAAEGRFDRTGAGRSFLARSPRSSIHLCVSVVIHPTRGSFKDGRTNNKRAPSPATQLRS